jgi:hypothetical protein
MNNLILYPGMPEVEIRSKAAVLFCEDFWLSSLSPETFWHNTLTQATAASFDI